jgi:HK97 family phage major capsid protein
VKTVQELMDERARHLDVIDDVINTAKEAKRSLTDDERERHDAAVAAIEGEGGLDAEIARAEVEAADGERLAAHELRRSRYDVPNINVRGNESVGAGVTRSLDSLLWATNESVRAGGFDRAGNFIGSGAQNAVEQVIVRNDDGLAVQAPRISEFRDADRQAIRSFQKTVADMAVFGLLTDKAAKTSRDGFEVARSHRLFKDRWGQVLRALDVDTSGEGGTWVPTGIGADMHEKVRAAGKVAALFTRINLPTNPWKWPIEGGDVTAYRVGEPTGDSESAMTASTPGTVAATFDAEIFGARALFSRSLEADSALAILPFVNRKLIQAFVDAEEKAILDGDTDGTHQDADVGASTTDARTAWDGLRKKAIAQTIVTATSTTVANLLLLRGGMGKWGINPTELAFIVGVSAYHDLIGDSNLLTVDKMGPQATILNGMVGSVGGVPVIVSEHVRENLNATGVQDGITTTKTYNLCVNRGEWAMGQRMALDVEVDDSIYRQTFQRVLVGFMREDFQHIGDAATNEDTAISYNVTP